MNNEEKILEKGMEQREGGGLVGDRQSTQECFSSIFLLAASLAFISAN